MNPKLKSFLEVFIGFMCSIVFVGLLKVTVFFDETYTYQCCYPFAERIFFFKELLAIILLAILIAMLAALNVLKKAEI